MSTIRKVPKKVGAFASFTYIDNSGTVKVGKTYPRKVRQAKSDSTNAAPVRSGGRSFKDGRVSRWFNPKKASSGTETDETELATQLIAEVASATPDVDVLCDTYGLRREELSRLTGFSLRALADWSAGKLPSQPALRRLQEIRRLLDALSEIVQPSAIPAWIRKPNPAFDRLAPLQVIELGEIDRLWEMIHQRG
jgi:DNA-binding transcriptional regulator YiaG